MLMMHWMQNAQLNWVFLTWSLCFIALLFMTIVLCFLFPLFLDKNSNARGVSKKFWVQKAQLNWVFLTWSLCFIALLFVWFLFSLFLGFALHNIHASYFRLFLFSFYKIKKNKKIKKKEGKRKQIIFLYYLPGFWKQGSSIYFHVTCLCILFSLDELIYCTLLVEALKCMSCGKMFIVCDHFVLILKSHVFDCWTWTFWERHK